MFFAITLNEDLGALFFGPGVLRVLSACRSKCKPSAEGRPDGVVNDTMFKTPLHAVDKHYRLD